MTIKHIFPAISLALVFASLGCSERDPEPSALVERVPAPTPMLTSTASVTEVEPALPDPEPGFEQKEITTTRPPHHFIGQFFLQIDLRKRSQSTFPY